MIETEGTPLDELPLTARVRNALKNDGISTIEGVEAVSDAELLRLPNFGRGSLERVRAEIKAWRARHRRRSRAP